MLKCTSKQIKQGKLLSGKACHANSVYKDGDYLCFLDKKILRLYLQACLRGGYSLTGSSSKTKVREPETDVYDAIKAAGKVL